MDKISRSTIFAGVRSDNVSQDYDTKLPIIPATPQSFQHVVYIIVKGRGAYLLSVYIN